MPPKPDETPHGEICQAVAELVGRLHAKPNGPHDPSKEEDLTAIENAIKRYYKAFYDAHKAL